jgi:hypothetical protein
MPNKKISQFSTLTNLTGSEIIPVVINGNNYKVELSALTEFVNTTDNFKHWLENKNEKLSSDETLVIAGNYVLSGTNLTLESSNLQISIGNIDFNKRAQIFIGGYLLLIDSNIINNGEITVGGAIIFSGDSTIIGTGIIN